MEILSIDIHDLSSQMKSVMMEKKMDNQENVKQTVAESLEVILAEQLVPCQQLQQL